MANEYAGMSIERNGDVVEMTFTRPELLNRIDDEMHVALSDAFRQLDGDPGVRAVILASTGKVFSAGGDFDLMMAKHENLAVRWQKSSDGIRLLTALLDVRVPVIVAMHGDAIGIGASIVLACDAVITHPAARLSDPHVKVGLVAADGGALVWPVSVGMMRAKKHLLTGDPVTGQEAYEMGLVTELVPTSEEVLGAARAFAQRIAELPPLAVQGTKRTLNRALHARLSEVIELGFAYQLSALSSDDLVEAIDSFKEKRKPNYKGQ